jgi:hypothetical protein
MSIRLDCADIAIRLDDFIADDVAAVLRNRIEDHLARCPKCACEARALRQTRNLLGSLPPRRLTPDRRERILEEFRKYSRVDGFTPRTGGETSSSPRRVDDTLHSATTDAPPRSTHDA